LGAAQFIPGDTLPRYTHDILVHASIPRLVGINTALEVDLTGQMNAEVAEGRHVGMVGDMEILSAGVWGRMAA
jgi:Acetyl-CoA hydrolase/transferase C-terminal domain